MFHIKQTKQIKNHYIKVYVNFSDYNGNVKMPKGQFFVNLILLKQILFKPT